MEPQFFVEEDEYDPNAPNATEEDIPTITSPVNNSVPETPTSNTSKSRRKTSPRDNVRRRTLAPSKWVVNAAKAALNAGKQHITPRGVLRRGREVKPACPEKCRKCSRRLLPHERQKLHEDFWKLSDINRKRDYITRHVGSSKPQTSHTLPEKTVSCIRKYTFTIDDKEVKVCKVMFLKTLDIVDSWIQTSLKNCNSGNGLSPDKRGSHKNRPRRTPEIVYDTVRTHINAFIKVPSHYTREKSKREYLEPQVKSVQNMYRLYKIWCSENNYIKIASESIYRRTFNREFNLGFFLPRKDQCELCSRWKNSASNDERQAMLQEYSTHLTNKKTLKALRKKELEDIPPFTCIACFDLEKVLTCPRSEVSSFFYKNKLSLFNFTVFECVVKIGHCYLWTEVDAMKEANEVGSNLYNFIEAKALEGYKDLILYSDSPSGQNRNRMVFSMFLLASKKFKVNITHRFLESGHSYSEADSMHARIEDEATLKNIYNVEEWSVLIQGAKKEGETYVVNRLLNNKVLDLHYLVDRQNWAKNTDNQKVQWSNIREIKVTWERPNILLYRNNFTDDFKTVQVSLKPGHVIDMDHYTPPQAYKGKFPLKENKAKDIQWLMDKLAIPSKYRPFYEEVLAIKE